MKTVIISSLVLILMAAPIVEARAQADPAAQPAPNEAATWQKVAQATPLGSRVKARTFARKRYTGTLMQADDTGIVIKRNTRLPEPPVTIRYDELARLEQDRGGMSMAKAVGIGVAAGAGAMLSLILMAFALSD